MTDDLERRIGERYEGLRPEPEVKARLLEGLPAERSARRRPVLPLLAAAAVAAILVVIVALGSGPDIPDLPPMDPLAQGETESVTFRADGETEEVRRIMQRRLAARGMEEAEVVRVDAEGGLEVRFPRGVDYSEAAALLARPGTLEFRIVAEPEPGEEQPDGTYWAEDVHGGPPGLLEEPGGPHERFGGEDLDPAEIRIQPSPQGPGFVVLFAVRPERTGAFGDFTEKHRQRQLAIVVDGRVEAAPVIQERLPGRAQISGGGIGGFSREEAHCLAAVLLSGPLPVRVLVVPKVEEGR